MTVNVDGNPLDTKTDMGPVISKKQKDTILSYIETGKQEGGYTCLRRQGSTGAGL